MIGFSFRRTCVTGLAALALCAVTVAPALAQSATFRGKVTSEKSGEPIVGASVGIGELSLSVLTTAQGTYVLTVPASRVNGQSVTLTVRAIGFKSVSRIIAALTAGERTVDVPLGADINKLEEIIVTGVLEGTERAKVPFAVGRLTTEDLPVPAVDPIRALAGKVAGLRIGATTGRPGSAPEIMLRGPTSINATGRSQEPLIVVDGVILHVGSYQELGGLDIESVEVVKGAAGASLYGTQAANGVITITTKRGSKGQDGVKFNARTEWGFSDFNSVNYGMPINHPLQLDETGKRFCAIVSGNQPCSRSVDLMTEMLRINNVNADTIRTPLGIVYNVPNLNDLRNIYQSQIYPNQYYNSLAQISDRHPTSLSSLEATGKVGSVGFYVSGEYTDDPGAVKFFNGSNQRRGRLNLDYSARPDLTINVSTMFDNFYRDQRTSGIFGTLLRGGMPGFNYLAAGHAGPPPDRSRRVGMAPHRQRGGQPALRRREHGVGAQVQPLPGQCFGQVLPGQLDHVRRQLRLRQPAVAAE